MMFLFVSGFCLLLLCVFLCRTVVLLCFGIHQWGHVLVLQYCFVSWITFTSCPVFFCPYFLCRSSVEMITVALSLSAFTKVMLYLCAFTLSLMAVYTSEVWFLLFGVFIRSNYIVYILVCLNVQMLFFVYLAQCKLRVPIVSCYLFVV